MTQIKPYIQQQFTGQIWKLMIDTPKQMLFIEIRDAATHRVAFSGFDLLNGNSNFIDLMPDEKWLTGLEGCYNGVVFLHGYQSAQSPVHKGIIAIDGTNGQTLWNNYTYAMQHMSVNGPVAYNTQMQPKKLFILDALNGVPVRPFNELTDEDLLQDITVPDVIEYLDDTIKQHVEGEIKGNIHYINYNSFRIVSLHSSINSYLSQILLVMQGDNLVYRDLLIDGIQKLQPEAFIMQQNRLIYIKNKVELKVLNL